MTFSYFSRMLFECLASFFLLHLALGLLVSVLSPAIVRWADRMSPHRAAAVLLSARFFPAGLSLFAVVVLCIPSYLELEPRASGEEFGFACLGAACLGATICCISLLRGAMAAFRSAHYISRCRQTGRDTRLPGESCPAVLIDANSPVLALSGLFKPRLIVSRGLCETLSPDELRAALLHERAHQTSRDNLKRLSILLAPGILPFFRGFDAIESSWARIAEWAADDRAAGGDPQRSAALAGAMVRVARLGMAQMPSPLSTSLLPDRRDLEARVDRLLHVSAVVETGSHSKLLVPLFLAAAAISAALLLTRPAVLSVVHSLLESLAH